MKNVIASAVAVALVKEAGLTVREAIKSEGHTRRFLVIAGAAVVAYFAYPGLKHWLEHRA